MSRRTISITALVFLTVVAAGWAICPVCAAAGGEHASHRAPCPTSEAPYVGDDSSRHAEGQSCHAAASMSLSSTAADDCCELGVDSAPGPTASVVRSATPVVSVPLLATAAAPTYDAAPAPMREGAAPPGLTAPALYTLHRALLI